jgi:N-acetylglucosaminyl-diphospho-decaprenol L-rhamnosyltransferase
MSHPRIAGVILNYRTADLVNDLLESLCEQNNPDQQTSIIVDNASGDGSPDAIHRFINEHRFESWARVICSPDNNGFSAGNNLGIKSIDSDKYLLLNSDTIVRPNAIRELLHAANLHPDAGIIAPRLEWTDGTPQQSCFPTRTPRYEFFSSAGTGFLEKAFGHKGYSLPISDTPCAAEWVSFAAVLIRKSVFEKIGLLDEGFFMYFEDMDFCYRARKAGIGILYWPHARVVHLRGGSSPVKQLTAERKRPPKYWYASRNRYYAKHFGILGLWRANLLWYAGRAIAAARELVGNKQPHTNKSQWRDIWINAMNPLKRPERPPGT